MNRKGMTAFMDALIFLVVIMMAIAVTISSTHPEYAGDTGADDFLRQISSVELRLSDMTDIDDDSLVFLPDVMALSLFQDSDVQEYLEDILDRIYGQDRYRLEYSYDGRSEVLGAEYNHYFEQDSRTIPVSIGGSLYVSLSIL